ncbi:UNVERIFIED_CONTAM: hypothetical protein GTU68_014194 [Idotea baltica]|nr:hypothetical protein [Idotea baltica]
MLSALLGVAKLLRPDKPNPEKNSTYESGEAVEGEAIVSFNIKFYVIAIIFLLFEVELVLLFPWATVFGSWAWYAIGEMFVFIFLLTLGLVYAWREGHLDWIKSSVIKSDFEAKVPMSAYESINEKYQ